MRQPPALSAQPPVPSEILLADKNSEFTAKIAIKLNSVNALRSVRPCAAGAGLRHVGIARGKAEAPALLLIAGSSVEIASRPQ
jgi:hypothetical protein